MAIPLSPLPSHAVNSITTDEDDITWHDPPSSPFIDYVGSDQENIAPLDIATTPTKPPAAEESIPTPATKHSSPVKGLGLKQRVSPVKAFPKEQLVEESENVTLQRTFQERTSPKKVSPMKDLRVSQPELELSNSMQNRMSPSKISQVEFPATEYSEPTLRENEGLTVAMKILEETRSESHHESHHITRTDSHPESHDPIFEDSEFNPDATSMTVDDTCFSTFSEIPNMDMTKFAMTRNSPTKHSMLEQALATPRARGQMTPGTARRHHDRTPSPTPRRHSKTSIADNDTTNLLLDFTQQIEAFSTATRRSPTRSRQSPTKSSTEPNLLSYIQNQRSPAKTNFAPSTPAEKQHLLNLLDFELPPPPTPRSIPTITIRELESLKSSYQSQISSLTASLSGKEAEIESLIKAVNNAERRVGEAQEALREERSAREHAESQKAEWEKKGTEVEEVLRSIKKEVMRSDQEREDILRRLEEAERRAEEAEARASDAETRAIEAEGKCVDTTVFAEAEGDAKDNAAGPRYTAEEVQKQIDEKVATLCRELHVVYKKKHETKVAALKKSYEAKAEKKTVELQKSIKELTKQVEELQARRDATFSKVLPADFHPSSTAASTAKDLKRLEEQQAEIEEQRARLAGMAEEVKAVRLEHTQLLKELELERVEKGELVAAAEQMLALQMELQANVAAQEDLRKSVGAGNARPSGLRGPGFAGGLSRSANGIGGKSRIMSNIERMGGRGAQPE